MVGKLIVYNGKPAVIVETGEQLTANIQTDMRDHVGLWFGEVNASGKAIVYMIPAEYVKLESAQVTYQH